ncbi:UNVERIFIED_CONTAM: hypothetical protein Sradi_2627900 [Sesamum radiatum]|uniref:Uncharacterized protein n=1 Tax=Sesamum radiatum TaxID=300843 RepID=A0AAW2S6X2_SESRA
MHDNAIGGFSRLSQKGHDPFSNTYNPRWRDHPNLRYGNQISKFSKAPYQPPPPPPPQTKLQFRYAPSGYRENTRLEYLTIPTIDRASIQNLEVQVSQLTSSVSCLESQDKAMYDLGVSVNVMPLTIYESLNVGP